MTLGVVRSEKDHGLALLVAGQDHSVMSSLLDLADPGHS